MLCLAGEMKGIYMGKTRCEHCVCAGHYYYYYCYKERNPNLKGPWKCVKVHAHMGREYASVI